MSYQVPGQGRRTVPGRDLVPPEPTAIAGMACRFPGADDPGETLRSPEPGAPGR
jgi:hypothetical protein